MNSSPLFTGGAGSGESEIRRWMLENDWVEAIVALPTDLFYNTGIPTYVWLLTNRKSAARHDEVQLIDASGERFWKSMRKALGSNYSLSQMSFNPIVFGADARLGCSAPPRRNRRRVDSLQDQIGHN